MGIRFIRARGLLALSLAGFMGCQWPQFMGGTPSSAAPATVFPSSTSNPPQNLVPPLVQNSIDGSDRGENSELPKLKKVDACLATAKLMASSGKINEAIIYYEQVRQLDPTRDLYCARQLAVLYDRKGNFDKALDEYNRLLKANPRDAETYNDLGYGYYTRAQWELAEKNLRKSLELDAKNKRAWSNLGMTLAQLGRYEESLNAFEKTVSRPQALCNIAFIQAAQGKKNEAKETYAMALKLEPTLQKARAALERIDEAPSRTKERDRRDVRERGRPLPPDAIDPSLLGALPPGLLNGDPALMAPSSASQSDMVRMMPETQAPPQMPTPAASMMPPAPLPVAPSLPSTFVVP